MQEAGQPTQQDDMLTRRQIISQAALAPFLMPGVLNATAPKWTWVKIGEAPFSPRDSCRRFFHEGMVWLSHGYQFGNKLVPDLWSSDDGLDWTLRNPETPYLGWCPVASYDGAIIAVGEAVHRSDDLGKTFRIVADRLPFVIGQGNGYRTSYTWQMTEFAGHLMLFADDRVWFTKHLIDWDYVKLPWPQRHNFALEILDGEVHIIGGDEDVAASPPEKGYKHKTGLRDHWKSANPLDPGSWVLVTDDGPFGKIMWPGTCISRGAIWLAGGYRNHVPENSNETYSFDGDRWRKVETMDTFTSRHYPAMLEMNGRIFLTTGNRHPDAGELTNDIWELVNL